MKVILTVATVALFMASTSFAQCADKTKKCCGEKKSAKSEAVQECSKKKCCDKKDAKNDAVQQDCSKKKCCDKGENKSDK